MKPKVTAHEILASKITVNAKGILNVNKIKANTNKFTTKNIYIHKSDITVLSTDN